MIIDQINLTSHEHVNHRIRVILFSAVAGLIIFITVANLAQSYRIIKARRVYQSKLDLFEQQLNRLPTTDDSVGQLNDETDQALTNKGMRINHMIARDRFPLVSVLTALEKNIPEVVIIDSFNLANDFTEINLFGRTDSLDALVHFQKQLENDAIFASVVLDNMGLPDASANGSRPKSEGQKQFKLQCRLQLDQVLPEDVHGPLWRALKRHNK